MNYDDYLLMQITLDDLLNWLDRPDTASLELYPREVKACRCLLLNIKEELEVYKRALDWLANRCEKLDMMANSPYECVWFKAKKWKEVALQKARDQN